MDESYGSHTTSELVQAVSILEAYPHYAGMVKRIKKDILARFKGIEYNKRCKSKKLGLARYRPNGVVTAHIYCYNQVYTTQVDDGYKVEVPVKIKKNKPQKVSVAREEIKKRLAYIPLIYKYLAYGKVKLKTGRKYFNFPKLLTLWEMSKKIEQMEVSEKIKEPLRTNLWNKIKDNLYGFYSYSGGKETDANMCEAVIQRLFGNSQYFLWKKSTNSWRDDKNYQEKMTTEFEMKMYLPTKRIIDHYLEGSCGYDGRKEFEALKEEVTLRFNNFKEMIDQLRDTCLKINAENKLGLQMIGFEIPEEVK